MNNLVECLVIENATSGYCCTWVLKPADKMMYNTGSFMHRTHGQSVCCIDKNGNVVRDSCQFYLNNKRMKLKKFRQQLEIIHLTDYPYDGSSISPEDLLQCQTAIAVRKERYRGLV